MGDQKWKEAKKRKKASEEAGLGGKGGVGGLMLRDRQHAQWVRGEER